MTIRIDHLKPSELYDLHPCFHCTLPECDEHNKNCGLLQAMNAYRRCLYNKTPVSDEIRFRRNIAYNELYMLDINKRSKAKKRAHCAPSA